jgi:hypothetical protein
VVRTVHRSPLTHNRIRFDLDQHPWIDQRADFEHARRRSNRTEDRAVRPADRVPVTRDIDDEHSRPDDIGHHTARLFDGGGDVGECLTRLGAGVTDPDDLPCLVRRRRSGDEDAIADADRA